MASELELEAAGAASAGSEKQLLRQISARLDEMTTLQRFALLGPDKTLSFLYRDQVIRMHLPYGHHDFVQRVILKTNNFYEVTDLEKLPALLAPGAFVVDAGANIGNHTVYFSRICGAAHVTSFEPMRNTFAILQQNAGLNAPNRIRCINAALGASPGRARLHGYRAHNMGGTSIRHDDDGAYELTTIDAQRFERVDFLKIDVEGAQVALLEGARETLARCRPTIWIEMHPSEFKAGHDMLTSLGYVPSTPLSKHNFIYVPS